MDQRLSALAPVVASAAVGTWTVRKQLQRSELAGAPVVLGIDFAVQTFPRPNQAPLWRPHAYMLIGGCPTVETRAALEPHYPSGPRTPRPIHSRKIDKKTVLRVTSYTYKSAFNIGCRRKCEYQRCSAGANAPGRTCAPPSQVGFRRTLSPPGLYSCVGCNRKHDPAPSRSVRQVLEGYKITCGLRD